MAEAGLQPEVVVPTPALSSPLSEVEAASSLNLRSRNDKKFNLNLT